jgi:hypothetical protein
MKLPRYVHAFIDRHGRSRFYLRRKGHSKVPLPGLPWSPAFMEAYERALAAYKAPGLAVIGASRTVTGTLNAAVVAYYQSAAFKSELGASARWSSGFAPSTETSDCANSSAAICRRISRR